MESVFGLIGPAVARESMSGARDWGFIAASFGVGTLLGGILSLKVNVKYPMRFATLCTFAFAGLPLALAVPLPVYLVAIAALIDGVAGQTFAVLWYTTLLQKIPAEKLSRLSSYDQLESIAHQAPGIVEQKPPLLVEASQDTSRHVADLFVRVGRRGLP